MTQPTTKQRAIALAHNFEAHLRSGGAIDPASCFAYMDLTRLIRQYERGDVEEPTLAAKCDALEGK